MGKIPSQFMEIGGREDPRVDVGDRDDNDAVGGDEGVDGDVRGIAKTRGRCGGNWTP